MPNVLTACMHLNAPTTSPRVIGVITFRGPSCRRDIMRTTPISHQRRGTPTAKPHACMHTHARAVAHSPAVLLRFAWPTLSSVRPRFTPVRPAAGVPTAERGTHAHHASAAWPGTASVRPHASTRTCLARLPRNQCAHSPPSPAPCSSAAARVRLCCSC